MSLSSLNRLRYHTANRNQELNLKEGSQYETGIPYQKNCITSNHYICQTKRRKWHDFNSNNGKVLKSKLDECDLLMFMLSWFSIITNQNEVFGTGDIKMIVSKHEPTASRQW